jgi:hypothetical protein
MWFPTMGILWPLVISTGAIPAQTATQTSTVPARALVQTAKGRAKTLASTSSLAHVPQVNTMQPPLSSLHSKTSDGSMHTDFTAQDDFIKKPQSGEATLSPSNPVMTARNTDRYSCQVKRFIILPSASTYFDYSTRG